MSDTASGPTAAIREAVGVFHHWSNLQAAVDDLLLKGFDRSHISLLASEAAVEEKLGHVYSKVAELEDDPRVPRTAFTATGSITEAKTAAIGTLGYVGAAVAAGAIVASGGTLAAAILGAVLLGGGGAALGAIASRFIGRDRAKNLEAQIDKGGLLLWVRTVDPAHEKIATEVLAAHGADDIHVHDIVTEASPESDPLDGVEPDPFLPQARL